MGLLAAGLVMLFAAVPAALLVALFFWAGWLRRQTPAPRYAPWAAYALLALGAVQAVRGPVSALVALGRTVSRDISPGDRQRVLANGIAEAMYGGMLTAAIFFAVGLWLLLCTWRWRWARTSRSKG